MPQHRNILSKFKLNYALRINKQNTGTGLQYLVSAILLVVVPVGAIAFIVWLINTLIISRL